MRAIVYSRVSTEDQAKHGYSLASQVEAGRAKAVELGANEIYEFSDEGISGEILNRPGLDSAFDMLSEIKIDYFICLDPDRFARKLALQLIATDTVENSGAHLIFVNVEFQNTPEGRLFYAMRGAYSEYEKEKIKERSRRGKLQKAKEGKMTHNPRVYGYDYVDSYLVINEEQARILKLMFNWVADEMASYNAVATRLNEMGIPSPRNSQWTKATAKRILQNQDYLGTIYLNKHNSEGVKNNRFKKDSDKVRRSLRPESEWIPINIPPIIEDTLFWRVQDILKDARRRKPGIAIGQYLLSGLIECGECNSTYNGTRTLSKTKKYYLRYYRCSGRINGICHNEIVKADEIESSVWGKVKLWLMEPELLVAEANNQSSRAKNFELELTELNNALTAAENEKDRLVTMYQKGYIDESEMDKRMKGIQARIRTMHDRLKTINRQRSNETLSMENFDYIKELSQKVGGKIDDLDFYDKQRLVKMIIDKIVVKNGDAHAYVKSLNAPGPEPLEDSYDTAYSGSSLSRCS